MYVSRQLLSVYYVAIYGFIYVGAMKILKINKSRKQILLTCTCSHFKIPPQFNLQCPFKLYMFFVLSDKVVSHT